MKQTITITLFEKSADFFINAKPPIKVVGIKPLDREKSAVEITIEAEN